MPTFSVVYRTKALEGCIGTGNSVSFSIVWKTTEKTRDQLDGTVILGHLLSKLREDILMQA